MTVHKEHIPYAMLPEEMAKLLKDHGIDSIEKLQSLVEPNLYAVIPMQILERKDLTANAKLLYAEINALAKKSGVCFASNEYMATRMGLSRGSMKRIVSELAQANLIEVKLKRDSKGTYRTIFVKWGGGANEPQGVGLFDTIHGANEPQQKRIRVKEIEKEINLAPQSDAPFVLKEEIKKLEDSPRRDLNIVALYFDERRPDLQTREQFQAALRRHLRAAKQLTPFNDTQIVAAARSAKRQYPELWTIDTLVKLVTK